MKSGTALRCGAVLLVLACFGADRPAEAPPQTPSVAELLKARVDAAADGMRLSQERYRAGMCTGLEVDVWVQRWTDARIESAQTKEQRLAIMREGVAAMKEHESNVTKMFQAGLNAGQTEVTAAKYERLGAELRLARALAE
jgi:outer membrane protein TolC